MSAEERHRLIVEFDVAFIGADGVSVARGLVMPDRHEATLKRELEAAGPRVVRT